MARTPEQVAADEALTAAVEQARRAYFPDDGAELLTDYVIVYAGQSFDQDGDDVTAIGTLVRDGSLPAYRVNGLLVDSLGYRLGKARGE